MRPAQSPSHHLWLKTGKQLGMSHSLRVSLISQARTYKSFPPTELVNRLPIPFPFTPLPVPPTPIPPHPQPILYSMKDYRPCGCQGNQVFYSIPVTGCLGLRSGVTTGAQALGNPPPHPPLSKGEGVLHPCCLFTQPQLGGTEPLGSQERPGCGLGEISAPQAPLWPWPFPEDNSLHERENSIAQGSSLQGVAGASV